MVILLVIPPSGARRGKAIVVSIDFQDVQGLGSRVALGRREVSKANKYSSQGVASLNLGVCAPKFSGWLA